MNLHTLKETIRPIYHYLSDLIDWKGHSLLKNNEKLKDLHKNKRCFIIATGASLLELDLSKLKNEFTFGFNFIFLHEEFMKKNLKYYLIGDVYKNVSNNLCFPKALNIKKRSDQPFTMFSEMFKMNDDTTLIINRKNASAVNKHFKAHAKRPYYFKPNIGLLKNDCIPDIDLKKRFVTHPGSIFMAIQIAIYMGFKEIYLAGAGYSYYPANEYHFYDSFEADAKLGYDEAEESAKLYISQRNKKSSGKLEYLRLVRNKEKYYGIFSQKKSLDDEQYKVHSKIKSIAESNGVKILNIVPDGYESPIYEKISWEKVVKEVITTN